MIKKMEDWSFTEYQAYAKGFLEGMWFGICISSALIGFGIVSYIHFFK